MHIFFATIMQNHIGVDTGKTKDRGAWETTVNRMISKGVSLNAEEKAALIDYLVSK